MPTKAPAAKPKVAPAKKPAAKPAAKKPTPVKKPVAKTAPADGIKKTGTPAKVTPAPAAKKPAAKKPAKDVNPITLLKGQELSIGGKGGRAGRNVDALLGKEPVASIKAPPLKPEGGLSEKSKGDLGTRLLTSIKDGLKEYGLVQDTVKKALPTGFGNDFNFDQDSRLTRLGPLDGTEPQVKVANVRHSYGDYLVTFFGGNGGEAVRSINLQVGLFKGRVSNKDKALKILKAAIAYENRRSDNKSFRGLTGLSAQVLRYATDLGAPVSFLFHIHPVEATGLSR